MNLIQRSRYFKDRTCALGIGQAPSGRLRLRALGIGGSREQGDVESVAPTTGSGVGTVGTVGNIFTSSHTSTPPTLPTLSVPLAPCPLAPLPLLCTDRTPPRALYIKCLWVTLEKIEEYCRRMHFLIYSQLRIANSQFSLLTSGTTAG